MDKEFVEVEVELADFEKVGGGCGKIVEDILERIDLESDAEDNVHEAGS